MRRILVPAPRKAPADLIAGFRRFQQRYFGEERSLYEGLVRQGQTPKIMIVACCDSRVDPAILTDCDPGDLFVVRNVANLVPPCEAGGGYHGTSAAFEFAVCYLKVEHVIVMGHARCGGIRALIDNARRDENVGQFISPWMSITAPHRSSMQWVRCSCPDSRAMWFVVFTAPYELRRRPSRTKPGLAHRLQLLPARVRQLQGAIEFGELDLRGADRGLVLLVERGCAHLCVQVVAFGFE